ncbi:INTS11 family MBL fold metallo-hydrolase [Rubrivirga sp. IMCC43871]|uniref:INTS11 family MBL fold metallo-hydrolase n=1 Tax=Rubrivirga sp. IMCC43871 TaxID=3391575 RepID=UPI00398FCC95
MKYISLGDTDEIAASCHHLTFGGTGLILDAGMDPDKDGYAAVPPFELLKSRPVDHVVITHAHHDHLGSLPVLSKEVPHAQIHMSRPTALLAEMLLPSSARLQKRRVREGSTTTAPVFDVEMAEALSYLYDTHLLDTPFDLRGHKAEGPLAGTFYHASHVLGAVGLMIEGYENGQRRRVFYTSDTSLQPQTILPEADYPAGPVDVLLLESTLGADPDAETTSRKAEEKRLGQAMADVLEGGGVVLLPVFALGRSQDMLALIDRFKRRGLLPEDTPVYTAGSMRGVAEVYDKTRESTPRMDPDFEVYGVDQERYPRTQKRKNEALAKPGIFVLTSGMLFERTPSFDLARQIVSDSRHGIFFVGFSKEGSPGDRLQIAASNGGSMVFDSDEGPVSIKARIERFRFSGHSHRQDLIAVVEHVKPRTVVLVHGESAAKAWMKETIERQHPDVRVIVPEQGEEIEL